MEKPDYLNTVVALLSIIAIIVSLFAPQFQLSIFIGGLIGLAISIILLKVMEYMKKVQDNENKIKDLTKELNIQKQLSKIKKDIAILQTMIGNKLNKKNKKGSLSNLLIIIIILILVYLILLGLGFVQPLSFGNNSTIG